MNEKWTTKNGDEIEVKNMTTQHIKNTINAIESGKINFLINVGWEEDNDYQIIEEDIETKENWINILENELKRRNRCL